MDSSSDQTGAVDPPGRQRAWFKGLPLWLRIAAPVVLLILLLGGTAAVIVASQPADPLAEARALCLSGMRVELEQRGAAAREMPLFSRVEEISDDEYRSQGSVTYRDDDGSEQRAQVRCVVRVEDGAMRVASIRFGG
jgi:hypothetical protein